MEEIIFSLPFARDTWGIYGKLLNLQTRKCTSEDIGILSNQREAPTESSCTHDV